MRLTHTVGTRTWSFHDLKDLLAKASPLRSGDVLAQIAAGSAEERVAARMCLADLPLATLIDEPVVPYELDDVTRLIIDRHDSGAFAPIAHLTVGDLRDWLLLESTDTATLGALARGVTPEVAAAVSKLMRNQDLIAVARKCGVVTRFRNTIGLPGRLSIRLQPNDPVDDLERIAISMLDGLLYGAGDAVIGVNPASDDPQALTRLWHALDDVRARFEIPTQTCVLTHVTSQLQAIERGAPVDLVFQSVAGTEQANASFGITLAMLGEARDAARSLARATVGDPAVANVMYFETGQGSALSAHAHHGVDQQTCEARAYAVARAYEPLLCNSVVGFIGPEYLFDGKQIIRAGLEDHFCGKLMGLPLGCDVCYTNHAEADSDDMDTLMTLLGVAGVTYLMGVPGADDVMLGYQSTSFHDALYLRSVLGLKRAPEFDAWLERMHIVDDAGRLVEGPGGQALLQDFFVAVAAMNDDVREAQHAIALRDRWERLRGRTRARIALGRAGSALPTRALLAFQLDHARARDAVHQGLDVEALDRALRSTGVAIARVRSAAADRAAYLLRPDLGRRLDDESRARLGADGGSCDVALVIGDGLSPQGVQRHAAALVTALLPAIGEWAVGPLVIAEQARVALGDEVGALLGARMVVVVIGERPGLTSPDSLGLYLTFAPRVGRNDAERNCISNVRPEGLPPAAAAARLAWLIEASFRLSLSGVALKDDSSLIDVATR